jgi:hypothetical protein
MNEPNNKAKIFKYNMSIYYQSTIIYFVAFLIYVIIRGKFVEDSVTLIFKDPIIYFFGFIVLISIISLLYNLYKNKHLEINGNSFAFVNRFRTKKFLVDDITDLKITTAKNPGNNRAFRLIRIKIRNRRRPIILRPYDYENEESLIQTMQEFKSKLKNHV